MPVDWSETVLNFWFGELDKEQWFKREPDVDAVIVERFGETYEAIRAVPDAVPAKTPREALAAVIVLDQFPRNMFRDSARAFESDDRALAVADRAIAAGFDATLGEDGRHFLYMPFMHAEDLAHQDRCVALFEAFGNGEALKFARLHRDIIIRFGRFPHRNAALGRKTTRAEQRHLDEHGGF